MKKPKPIKLSRRGFLKLSGTMSLGLALSACGPNQALTSTPISTNTPQPTATPAPTAIPTPTAAPTPTNTPELPVLIGNWASDQKTHQVDSRNMFPLVGGVNHLNRYALDMILGTLKLAVLQSQDLTQTADHDGLRNTISPQLDSNAGFKKQAFAVAANFAKLDEYKGEKDFGNLILIIERETVIGAVFKYGSSLQRYSVNKEGYIAHLEQPAPALPGLRVNGPYIERVDTEEKVLLKGISIFASDGEGQQAGTIFNLVKKCVETNEKVGLFSNFVRLGFYSKDTSASEFSQVADYLAGKGIYVVFTPHNPPDETFDDRYLPNERDKLIVVALAKLSIGKSNVIRTFA